MKRKHYSFKISHLVPGKSTIEDIRNDETAQEMLTQLKLEVCKQAKLTEEELITAFDNGRVKIKMRPSKILVFIYG